MSGPSIPDLTGRTIGEYEIVARVGVGGMGAVYEGRQPLIGKRVAFKVLLPTLSNEQELVERFLAEARAVNEIRHRGIVDIFSFGRLPEGSHYFVMEFLQGEAFDRVIKSRAPMDLGEALGWIDEVLDALEAAHAAGIIHRDIKPSNLFLVNTGRGRPYVKLLDFGIAKLGALQGEATPQTRASVILGTPDYISPEQARGRPISPQTDLYAVGCVLFEMLTGKRVFRGENTLQTMWMHVEDPPPVPSSLRPELPPELDEVVLWALQKDPANRPPSAAVLKDRLALIRSMLVPTGQFTPPPVSGSALPPVYTPPPSGRSRPVGTPLPRSGGQPALRTPRPSSQAGAQPTLGARGAPAEQTRLTPLSDISGLQPAHTAEAAGLTGEKPAHVPAAQEPGAPVTDTPSGSGRLVGVLVALLAVLGLGVGALLYATREPEAVTTSPQAPVAVKPEAPEKPDEVAKGDAPAKPDEVAKPDAPVKPDEVAKGDAPVKPDEVAKGDAPVKPDEVAKPDAQVKPDAQDARPVKRGISPEQLAQRLKRIEGALAKHEAQTGQKDMVLRQFVAQARGDLAAAKTDGQRAAAWKFLAEIEGQLK